jgi:hypothetical protein
VTKPHAAKLSIQGIIWGSPYVELVDTSAIQSSAGITAAIEYKGKGYFGGKSHSFKATVTHSSSGKIVQTYEGQWTGISHIGGSKGQVFLDTSAPKEEITVKPIYEQDEWESRRLWQKVAQGIRSANYDEASKEKSRIEVSAWHVSLVFFVHSRIRISDTRRTNSDRGERMNLLREPAGS